MRNESVVRLATQEGFVPNTSEQVPAKLEQQIAPSKSKNVVVVLRGDKIDAELVKLACSVSRSSKTNTILALYGIEVPRSQKLEEKMPDEEAQGADAIQAAKMVANRADVDINAEIVRTRSIAHTIIEEVNQRQCTLLIMGVPYKEKRAGTCSLDDMTEYVLENATCRVWLIRGNKEPAQH